LNASLIKDKHSPDAGMSRIKQQRGKRTEADGQHWRAQALTNRIARRVLMGLKQ